MSLEWPGSDVDSLSVRLMTCHFCNEWDGKKIRKPGFNHHDVVMVTVTWYERKIPPRSPDSFSPKMSCKAFFVGFFFIWRKKHAINEQTGFNLRQKSTDTWVFDFLCLKDLPVRASAYMDNALRPLHQLLTDSTGLVTPKTAQEWLRVVLSECTQK